ncbi:hypothetical protein RhiirC2_777425 [Rhizophagus irregularis]|uniref:DUF7431 domain-containing protein n=1 Tax=Rhizophagus irregularis TaxID=588596 RepID=A0A2N1NEB1_9GLOM|nr:hypothetical protein RhiirC2_777425 [Rhizophagus irregularis]
MSSVISIKTPTHKLSEIRKRTNKKKIQLDDIIDKSKKEETIYLEKRICWNDLNKKCHLECGRIMSFDGFQKKRLIELKDDIPKDIIRNKEADCDIFVAIVDADENSKKVIIINCHIKKLEESKELHADAALSDAALPPDAALSDIVVLIEEGGEKEGGEI